MSQIRHMPAGHCLGRVWLLGCGAMGGSLLQRWLQAGLEASAVTVIDPAPGGLPEEFAGNVVADIRAAHDLAANPTLVVLAVKPQTLPEVVSDLTRMLGATPLILSMLAGVRTATIARFFPDARIIRMMPNTPARIGRGVTALYAASAAKADRETATWLMEAAGKTVWLSDEALFDAVTAVSGSGPAFLFRFMETLATAGEAAGLERDIASSLALETIAGAAELARQSGSPPAVLREQVTSPGGTTEAGLEVLDADGVLFSLMRATVRAAADRSRELANAAAELAEKAMDASEEGQR